jgi:hypothetical protein
MGFSLWRMLIRQEGGNATFIHFPDFEVNPLFGLALTGKRLLSGALIISIYYDKRAFGRFVAHRITKV